MSEIKRPLREFEAVNGKMAGETYVIIGPKNTIADIARWAVSSGNSNDLIYCLREEMGTPPDQTEADRVKLFDYEDALKRIAGSASVTAPLSSKSKAAFWKKMYKGWRSIAASRIDVARAVLNLWSVKW